MRQPSIFAKPMSRAVTFSMPSTNTFEGLIHVPYASDARMIALCAASQPFTSSVGSASA